MRLGGRYGLINDTIMCQHVEERPGVAISYDGTAQNIDVSGT